VGAKAVKGIAEVTSVKSDKPNCWNPDITSDDSWVAFQGIVEIIKADIAH
jgi:hypothetical protein